MSDVTNKLLGGVGVARPLAHSFFAAPYVGVLKKFEGHIPKARKLSFFNKRTGKTETEEYYTVGYGDYGPHVRSSDTQTPEQSLSHLEKNITDRLSEIKRAIPDFDSLPEKTKAAVVVGWFRGSIKPQHKTVDLINQEKFSEAAKEFLNHEEYRTAEAKGKRGVISRMKYVSAGIAAAGDKTGNTGE